MKKLYYILFLVGIAQLSQAQKISYKTLKGRWHLVKCSMNGEIMIDAEKPLNCIPYLMKQFQKNKPTYTPEDSATAVATMVELTQKMSDAFFVDFISKNKMIWPDMGHNYNVNEMKAEPEIQKYKLIPSESAMVTYLNGTKDKSWLRIENEKLVILSKKIGT